MARPRGIGHFARSFTGRLLLGVLLIHVLLVPLLFGGVLYLMKSGYQDQFVDQARGDAFLLAKLVAQDIDRPDKLKALVDEMLLGGTIAFMQVNDAKGHRLQSTENKPPLPFKENFFFGQSNDHTYSIALPVTDDAGVLHGHLQVGYDEMPAEELIGQTYRRGLLIALAYIVLTFALIALLGPKLASPLRRLGEASRRIASGHLDQVLDVTTSLSELQDLAQDLEYMRRELVNQSYVLEYLALHDTLTGLSNRALLHDRLTQGILVAERQGDHFALLLLDLDRFKDINDSLGHHAGDVILQMTAARLRESVRATDTVTRLGGDEFAIILPLADAACAAAIAGTILGNLHKPFQIEQHKLFIGASIGIASYPADGSDHESLLRRADVAMYAAKRGGQEYCHYDESMDNRSLHRLTLGGELRQAIQNGELVLHYQPKVDSPSGIVTGVEALVRWQHPQRGLIPPDDFISLAESTGLIHPLTEWVLRQAISDCLSWRRAGHLITVAVNLSARNLEDTELALKLAAILRDSGLPAEALELELTESAIFTEPLHAHDTLQQLHSMGIALAIDDFGTGYSSMAHLKRLPIAQIKIDRSFVRDMLSNDNDAVIVAAIIDLAGNLGMTVVAEGVEDVRTQNRLQALGCSVVQGYYVSKPVAIAELMAWLNKATLPQAAQA